MVQLNDWVIVELLLSPWCRRQVAQSAVSKFPSSMRQVRDARRQRFIPGAGFSLVDFRCGLTVQVSKSPAASNHTDQPASKRVSPTIFRHSLADAWGESPILDRAGRAV